MDYLTALLGFFALVGVVTLGRMVFRSHEDCDDRVVDHVHGFRDEDCDTRAHQDKLKLAAERHGKPFKIAPAGMDYVRVHRDTPRSHDLQVIDEASRKLREGDKIKREIAAQTNVSRIGRK